MPKKSHAIPVNHFGEDSGAGISIERLSFENWSNPGEWEQPERHDRHSFFLLEKGSVTIEIDFERCHIRSPSAIYMHPDQVHRIIGFENVTVTAWAIDNEATNVEYLKLLEHINPVMPLSLSPEIFALMCEAVSLCIKISERQKDLVCHSVLRDHVNGLVGLIISTFRAQIKPAEKLTRAELLTKAFRQKLSHHFSHLKSPAAYAEKLNLSTAYLNECVKATTGQPVSYHIQQRVILEAKRLIYHSALSMKEVAATLGYDDYPYFCRFFTKATGIAPSAFRNKNRD